MHHLQLIIFLLLYISSQISDIGNGDDIQSFSSNVKIQKESTAKKNYSTQFSNSLLPTFCYKKNKYYSWKIHFALCLTHLKIPHMKNFKSSI